MHRRADERLLGQGGAASELAQGTCEGRCREPRRPIGVGPVVARRADRSIASSDRRGDLLVAGHRRSHAGPAKASARRSRRRFAGELERTASSQRQAFACLSGLIHQPTRRRRGDLGRGSRRRVDRPCAAQSMSARTRRTSPSARPWCSSRTAAGPRRASARGEPAPDGGVLVGHAGGRKPFPPVRGRASGAAANRGRRRRSGQRATCRPAGRPARRRRPLAMSSSAHTASARLEAAARREHREPLEQHARSSLDEQVVAPVDHRPQRLLARQGGARRRRSGAGSGRRGGPASWSRSSAADGAAASSIASGRPSSRGAEVGDGRPGRRHRGAKSGSSGVARSTNSCDRRRRDTERRDRRQHLARNAETLAAGGEDAHGRGQPRCERIATAGGGVDDVLAVVEHEHERPRREVVDDAFEPAALGAEREVVGDCRHVRDSRTTSEGPTGASSTATRRHATRVRRGGRPRPEPRLPRTARADERDDPVRLRAARRNHAQLAAAAHE